MTDGSRKSEESDARDERDENTSEQGVNGATAVADRVKLTDLTVVLDRSGSMGRRREAAMASFNDFLEEHRTLPDRARLTLTQFDHRYEPVAVGARLKQVEPLTAATYQPRGSTALLDAIGRTIEDTEARLKKRVEKRARKGKPDEAVAVIITIITDGMENASRHFTHKQVKAMIESKENDENWTFIFMGTSWESVQQGHRFGMKQEFMMDIGESPEAYREAQAMMSRKMMTVRERNASMRAAAVKKMMRFTEEERAQVRDKNKDKNKNESS
ncbi:MAG TPA: hypothetical protein DCX60_00760 [Phycisphaerales bacterium]|nr:hypothetical protein [Phycisphaerales bacterium]